MNKIPLTRPYLNEKIKQAVMEVLESGHWTEGPVTREFEAAFKDYVGCAHAVAVTSCTTGLEISLRALGITAGNEVIVPGYTHPATAWVVNIVGADTVVCDIDPDTLNIDYKELEEAITNKTRAIIPVSLFGNPLDWDRLHAIKKNHGIHIVEDAACSLGAEYRKERVGSQADISVFSFHPRKTLATGEGGMVTTNSDTWARWLRSYKHFGAVDDTSGRLSQFVMIGTNYKMSDILAAIGLEQLNEFDRLLKRREEICDVYVQTLGRIPGVRFCNTTPHGRHARQSFCILVERRDEILQALRERGVGAQIGTFALHREKAFQNHPRCRFSGDMGGSQYAYDHGLTLPLAFDLNDKEQQYVIDTLMQVLEKLKI